MTDVVILIGAGQIGQAIARRVGTGRHVPLADMRPDNASSAAAVMSNAGFHVSVATVDVSSDVSSREQVRVDTISPAIVMTPLARDELTGPRGEGYRRMIATSVAKRAGTPDEVGSIGALLMGPNGGFITGSDFLMDGGVTAAYRYGDVVEVRTQQ